MMAPAAMCSVPLAFFLGLALLLLANKSGAGTRLFLRLVAIVCLIYSGGFVGMVLFSIVLVWLYMPVAPMP